MEDDSIQLTLIDRKLREGAQIVGHKIGLTAVAMQQLLGVDKPDFGHILNTMMVQDGSAVDRAELIYPRVEGEITFLLKEDLRGPGVTIARVLAATEYVMPSLEIVDSRVAGIPLVSLPWSSAKISPPAFSTRSIGPCIHTRRANACDPAVKARVEAIGRKSTTASLDVPFSKSRPHSMDTTTLLMHFKWTSIGSKE